MPLTTYGTLKLSRDGLNKSKTLAGQFETKCLEDNDALYFEFDPKAVEDQDGDVGIIRFSDGSSWFSDAVTGKTWVS